MEIEKFVLGPLQTNCYLVYDEEKLQGVLIDPAVFNESIKNFIRENKIDIVCTINTHEHYDHVLGNEEFGYTVRDYRDLKDGEVIMAGSLRLEIIHTPGHSPGGISVKCKNVIFTGDTLFYEGVGRTDLEGGDYAALARSIYEKLLKLPDETRVLPGHGPETTIGHEREFNPFL